MTPRLFARRAVQADGAASLRIRFIGWCERYLKDNPWRFPNHDPISFSLLMPWLIHWVTEEIHVKDFVNADCDISTAHRRKMFEEVWTIPIIDLEWIVWIKQVDLEAVPHVLHCATWT